MGSVTCSCPEAYLEVVDSQGALTGEIYRLPGASQHDCEYIRRRNLLIPMAVEMSNKKGHRDTSQWDVQFLLAMDQLAKVAWEQGQL
jgi:hypothetical protein